MLNKLTSAGFLKALNHDKRLLERRKQQLRNPFFIKEIK